MSERKNILICPLDWGLGHATRCIPIIVLLQEKYNVYIGASGESAKLLKQEFPHLKHLKLPDYNVTYPKKRSMSWHMFFLLPGIISSIRQEKSIVKKIVKEKNIHFIISDNRYGCYHSEVPSIFITHQVNIQSPYFPKQINRLNKKFISRFKECWIPDEENYPGLAGDLSHPCFQNITSRYLGSLTRFKKLEFQPYFDITAILSGPEPQRTILEDKLFQLFFEYPELKLNIIRGVYSANENEKIKNINVYDYLSSEKLNEIIYQSKAIICRAGYSSIMDLADYPGKVLFIPTPQQTEQEYLAKIHGDKINSLSQSQTEITLDTLLQMEISPKETSKKMDSEILNWIEKLIH